MAQVHTVTLSQEQTRMVPQIRTRCTVNKIPSCNPEGRRLTVMGNDLLKKDSQQRSIRHKMPPKQFALVRCLSQEQGPSGKCLI